jgi:hypothetical protein
MAYKFNPFTDTLDLVGSSDSYIDGEVQYHSNLPVTLGSPAVNSAFLVRKGEGLYFISRKPAGIWVRELNNGNLDDWKYAGTFSDLYRDANFRIINDADVSKELAFSLSGITTGTTRTLTAPNKSGTIALTTDIPSVNDIELETDGTTTITTAQLPARGIAYAPEGESTYTVNLPTPDIRQSGLTFSLKTEYEEGTGTVFVTVVHAAVNLLTTYELDEDEGSIDFVWDGYAWRYDTAYLLRSFPSRVLQLPAASGTIALTSDFAAPPQIGSTTPNSGAFTTLDVLTKGSSLNLRTNNNALAGLNTFTNINNAIGLNIGGTSHATLYISATPFFALTRDTVLTWRTATNGPFSGTQTSLYAEDQNVLAQRVTTSPQTFRLYTTYGGTGGADFERLFIKGQTGGAFQIGTEKGGTGGARALEFQTDGVTRVTLGDAGGITVNSGNLVLTDNTGSETATFDAQAKLTANRTYDLPDSSGTIALLETLPAGGTKTYATFTATDNQPPAADFATLDTRNSIAVLDFDDATDESAVFVSIIPEAASLGSGLKIRLHWMATTATSGDVVWDVSLERMTTDLDSDSFDTIASGTAAANGTSGILTVTEITLTTIDSVTAGDGFRLKVTRDANNGSDSMSGDAELVLAEVRSAA